MRAVVCALLVCLSCNHADPPTRPVARAPSSAGSVEALRSGRFDDAERAASQALDAEPRDSQAAAVRAITRYVRAGTHLFAELREVADQADTLHSFDHERGRAAWIATLKDLEAVDRDLAVVARDPDFALELCLACLEYDWNHNGRIDDRDRKLFELEYDPKGGEIPETDPRRRPTFRFDVGDADWARAMIAFQRAGIELVLAYRWSELDKLFERGDPKLVIHLIDPDRVKHAHQLIRDGVGFADRCRDEYRAETDDDREWVPNPRQSSHAVPLAVDDDLYKTWAEITADVRRMLDSEEGLSIQQTIALLEPRKADRFPDAYVDFGRMLRQPQDIVLDTSLLGDDPGNPERFLRGLLGNGYAVGMRASPLIGRLRHMKDELEHGEDTFERKLRYLLWLN